MSYPKADDPQVLATVAEWLRPIGEVFVYHSWYANGGDDRHYFIRSLRDYQDLVRGARPRSDFTIFRKQQYPVRGVAGDELLASALAQIPDGELGFSILSLDCYPKPIEHFGGGCFHWELKEGLAECRGRTVGIGVDYYGTPEEYLEKLEQEVLIVVNQEPKSLEPNHGQR